MNQRQKNQVADFIEQQQQSMTSEIVANADTSNQEALRPLVSAWIENQVSFCRGEAYRSGEWTAQAVEYLRSTDAGLVEAHNLLTHLRDTLVNACLDSVAGVNDADVRTLLFEGSDKHVRYLIEHFGQYMRECEATEQRQRRSIVESVSRPVALLNAQGIIDTANRELGRCLNTTPDALAGQDFLALCDEKTASYLRTALRQKPSPQQAKPFLGALTHGTETLPARFHLQPLYDTSGLHCGATVCVDVEDIGTEKTETGLRYMEKYLLPVVPLPIQMIDRNGNVTYSSDAIRTLKVHDYDAKEPLCTHLYAHRAGGARGCPCENVFETGQFHMEELCYGGQKESRWYLVLMLPVPDDTGHIQRVACCIYDMTRRKHLQKQLESQIIAQQRSSLVAQIAVTVAHQLRNPLSVVLGFAEMMAKGLPPEQYSEAVSRILRNSIRCKDIVENLLDFGKGMPLERRPIDLETLIQESVRPLLTPAQNRMIEWRFSEQPTPVECVPEQMTQVILSLLDNALRVACERVLCTVENKAELVRVRIVDDGPGIPLDLRDRVFEPFFTTRREEGATGLGLSLARAVAMDYSGNLTISSSMGAEPDGACLILQLPKCKELETQMIQESKEAGTPLLGRRILVIDDEADLLDLLRTALYSKGYLVDAVGTGMDALSKLKENAYDAAVIDYHLTGTLTGVDVYEYIEQEHPDLAKRTLFITADSVDYQTHIALEKTRRPVLGKPFLMADFTTELAKFFK